MTTAQRIGCQPRARPELSRILPLIQRNRQKMPSRSAGVAAPPRLVKTSGDGIRKRSSRNSWKTVTTSCRLRNRMTPPTSRSASTAAPAGKNTESARIAAIPTPIRTRGRASRPGRA